MSDPDLNMRYVAAAMLAVLGGGEPSAANIKKILSSVGIDADDSKVDLVAKELAGKNIEELLEEGKGKLGSMPAAGAAPSGGAAPAGESHHPIILGVFYLIYLRKCKFWPPSIRLSKLKFYLILKVETLPPQLPPRSRRKRRKKMTIWDSVSSTNYIILSELKTVIKVVIVVTSEIYN